MMCGADGLARDYGTDPACFLGTIGCMDQGRRSWSWIFEKRGLLIDLPYLVGYTITCICIPLMITHRDLKSRQSAALRCHPPDPLPACSPQILK